MKIYTKTGDSGQTSLIGGTRVPKHHLRIDAYGTLDELNSCIGLVLATGELVPDKQLLGQIQDRLFVIGSQLAADPLRSRMKLPELEDRDITVLESAIDRMTASLPELRHFILPGGSVDAAHCHLARCVCRRAERLVTALCEESEVSQGIIPYLNRLSDYLFVLSRKLNQEAGVIENKWLPEGNKGV